MQWKLCAFANRAAKYQENRGGQKCGISSE